MIPRLEGMYKTLRFSQKDKEFHGLFAEWTFSKAETMCNLHLEMSTLRWGFGEKKNSEVLIE